MHNTQLVVQGKALVLPDFGHAVSDKFGLVGARRYVAAKAGLDPADIVKQTMKQVKDLCVAAGSSESDIKTWTKEYDSLESQYRKFSRSANALMASDPAFRQSWRPNVNKKGEFIGATTTYRKEKSLNASAKVRLENAEAENAKLHALLAKVLPSGGADALTA